MGFLYSQVFVIPEYPTRSFVGETVIVTGSNVGLGKEAARHIARLGASKLILAVRNLKSGEAAKADIEKTSGCGRDVIEVWHLDLSSYKSVQDFAQRANTLKRIDALLENAGISTFNFSLAEGYQTTITVNVISTFFLAFLLLPKLQETATKFNVQPRLTIVSSEVHAWTKFKEGKEPQGQIFPTLSDKKTANMREMYFISKLLEILVFEQIAPKMEKSGVILDILNPGMCHSELARDVGFVLSIVAWVMKGLLARSTEMGSRTLVAGVAAGPEAHGKYMHDGKVDDGALSSYVKSKKGEETGKKVWAELKDILEKIQPGVTQGY
jgi:NAD(P)-dependent dehydrogenase (short-subunit alcohol dehydrogenase family)